MMDFSGNYPGRNFENLYHHKKQLGLAGNGHDFAGPTKLWPLNHDVRITP